MLLSINPFDGKVLKRYKEITDRTVDNKIKQAHDEFLVWKKNAIPVRARYLRDAAQVLKDNRERYARLITLEMGKPITQALAEIDKCAWLCEHYAERTKQMLRDEVIQTEASSSYITFEPLGVTLAVMPWNFPFWQVFRQAVPALMAGNTVLLKHASNVPQCAEAIQEVFEKASLPKGCFQTLLISSKQVSKVLQSQYVRKVSVTGSEGAGAAVASEAGHNLKPSVLELGGSDPFIVLEDAILQKAVDTAVKARMQNTGQSCIAAKRFIVVDSVYDQFIEMMKAKLETLIIGDPLDEKTDIGPMAREDLLKDLLKQSDHSIKKGAKLVYGGERLPGNGYFVAPTLLKDVKPGMPAFDQETFGPLAAVVHAMDTEEAIALANQTTYGLGASLWTEDMEQANRLVKQINAGSVFVNEMVKSDPRLPFGGIKRSGYGRELSPYGIKEFVNIKTVWINQ